MSFDMTFECVPTERPMLTDPWFPPMLPQLQPVPKPSPKSNKRRKRLREQLDALHTMRDKCEEAYDALIESGQKHQQNYKEFIKRWNKMDDLIEELYNTSDESQ